MRLIFYATLLISTIAAITADSTTERNHKKRQIYREQVLPHAGGRIPDTAFETDRLFLNRLQKEGISVPDGVVPEQRNPQVYPFQSKSSRTVYRIRLSSDGRYTPRVGKYQHEEAPSIETTYLYPQIYGQKINLTPRTPAKPVYKQIRIFNPYLNQAKFQSKKKTQYLNITPSASKVRSKPYQSESYQNFNIINTPVVPIATHSSSNVYKSDRPKENAPSHAGNAHLFNNFDEYFNNFDLHDRSGYYYDDVRFYPKTHIDY